MKSALDGLIGDMQQVAKQIGQTRETQEIEEKKLVDFYNYQVAKTDECYDRIIKSINDKRAQIIDSLKAGLHEQRKLVESDKSRILQRNERVENAVGQLIKLKNVIYNVHYEQYHAVMSEKTAEAKMLQESILPSGFDFTYMIFADALKVQDMGTLKHVKASEFYRRHNYQSSSKREDLANHETKRSSLEPGNQSNIAKESWWECKRCGLKNKTSDQVCYSCGFGTFDSFRAKATQHQTLNRGTDPNTWNCKNCHYQNPKGKHVCSYCKIHRLQVNPMTIDSYKTSAGVMSPTAKPSTLMKGYNQSPTTDPFSKSHADHSLCSSSTSSTTKGSVTTRSNSQNPEIRDIRKQQPEPNLSYRDGMNNIHKFKSTTPRGNIMSRRPHKDDPFFAMGNQDDVIWQDLRYKKSSSQEVNNASNSNNLRKSGWSSHQDNDCSSAISHTQGGSSEMHNKVNNTKDILKQTTKASFASSQHTAGSRNYALPTNRAVMKLANPIHRERRGHSKRRPPWRKRNNSF
eukprot:CAMPEP_0115014170 /NCGR_PEP_ID=MMETSP0216-20121206/25894_1 /TAXON_ID=223996 /ORGANISM="Protocruzia adherens, Strain Boccale" /LENGTH=515 /DNA_ID=CAMNT_0002383809 /DNA_START=469 /DNA_END=2016 /DNA_ORIENTATION=-